MTITMCSSVDFTPRILDVKEILTSKGHTVNIPYLSEKIEKGELTMEGYLATKNLRGDVAMRESDQIDLIKRYWDLIHSSDAILVLNFEKKGITNYIGGNTLMEIGFAYGHAKKIYLYNQIPSRSERMHYIDEIISMKPIIINGNLDLIK